MITFLFIIDRKKNKTLILTSAEKSRFLAGYLISSHIKQRRLCDLTEVSLSIKLKYTYKKALLTNLSLIMPDQSNQPQAQNAGESKLVLLSKLFKYENFSVDYQLTPLS